MATKFELLRKGGKLDTKPKNKKPTIITAALAKEIADKIHAYSASVFQEYGLTNVPGRSSWSPSTLKISLSGTMPMESAKLKADESFTAYTQQDAEFGFLPVGYSGGWAKGDDGMFYRVTILKVNRAKYVFQYTDYPKDGVFLIRFGGIKVVRPEDSFVPGEGDDDDE